ncbi:MAG: hypothetical protein A2V67_10480 [Deltaproteobacteria bacterium RBG_13_61_14]|nr:MAG: hypothetical protein A2V67_10480 [Deltaproteobacteria bacterium RBG_13_61_14]
MKPKRKALLDCTILVILTFCIPTRGRADDTKVLPKHRGGVSIGYQSVLVKREFDDAGRNRELGFYFNHLNVTNVGEPVFNGILNGVIAQSGLPLPPIDPLAYDSTKKAETYLKARVDVETMILAFQYGVTDKLTLGLGFPYFTHANTEVEFQALLWPSDTFFADPIYGLLWQSVFGPKLLPNGALDMTPQAQQFIESLGYEGLSDWNGPRGIGDIRAGAKYRFLNLDKIKAASQAWGIIQTGQSDDERNLTDIAYGQGHNSIGIAGMVDLVPIKRITLNATGRYTWNLPTHRGIFMLDKSNPQFYQAELPTLHEFGTFEKGDFYELETEGFLNLLQGVDVFMGYNYTQSQADTINGDVVPITHVLARSLFGGISLSGVDGFLGMKPKVPVILNLYAQAIQTGRNTEGPGAIGADLSVYF